MTHERLVVVGASAGGVRALQALASQLAPDFPAPILAVQHVGSHPSILPSLLAHKGRLAASHAVDGERISPGRILVAPPDQHMMLADGTVRLSRAAKENHARPAIDPLFRSAAVAHGTGVIGVLLTGYLDDGTAGLQAIKRCGGTVVVQDPAEAFAPSMPASALRYVEVDHVVRLAEMGELLRTLVQRRIAPAPAATATTADIVRENEILLGKGDYMERLKALGKPSTFVCPDCEGSLWAIDGTDPPRYRCHTGHGYTLRSLQHAQAEATDEALWGALRALQEKQVLLETMAERQGEAGTVSADQWREEAASVARHAETLRAFIERTSPPLE
jgi:two-component system chemotaxis response regulator CheB